MLEPHSIQNDATVEAQRGSHETDGGGDGIMMMEMTETGVMSDPVEEQGSETSTQSVSVTGALAGDCSESSTSGSSSVTGVSTGSGDNSTCSESTAVTGGLSDEMVESTQLPTTADDISSINSIEKPIGGSVHESLEDEGDLSMEESALSTA